MLTDRDIVYCEYLVLRCRRRDPEAAAELVEFFQQPLLFYLRRIAGSEEDAWDAAQETWLAVLRSLHSLRDPRALPAFIFRIARNKALAILRRRNVPLPLDSGALELADCETNEPTFSADDAEDIHRALDRLSLAHREVLTLYFLNEMSLEDMALVLGVPSGTAKSRLHYAKKALRRLFESGGSP